MIGAESFFMNERFAYPAKLTPDEDGFMIRLPDVPSVITWGQDRGEALEMAADALTLVFADRIRNRELLPTTSPARGRPLVRPTALVAAKAALHTALLKANIGPTAFARKLGVDPKDLRRLLDPYHQSRLDGIEEALALLGRQLEIRVVDAA